MDDPEGGFMEYIEEIQEQVILVGVQLDENDNVKESQAESMSVMHLIHITLWTWRKSGSDPWNTMRT